MRRRLGGLGITLAFIPVGLIGSAAIIGGCGDGGGATAAITGAGTAEPRGKAPVFKPDAAKSGLSKHASVIARIPKRQVRVYTRPKLKAKRRVVRAGSLEGNKLPLAMLVKQRRGKWLQVYLPTRPNLSKGWIRRSSAKLRQTTYRVKIQLKAHRITVFDGKQRIMRRPIGVGKSLTPTPTGQYYITDLIRPPDPRGTYGPYAFGLSGHSPVLTTFAGGDGQLGLHGTDNPSALGTDVSHGCIRIKNGDIRKLARMLPIGTPLAIRS